MTKTLALLVEGNLDESAGRRVAEKAGFSVSVTYGRRGIGYIRTKIAGFNRAASAQPILALADLMDTGMDCPPEVVEAWLPHRNEMMLLRVVVREIESWLLADRPNLAEFLKIPAEKIPLAPEELSDPKETLINLARKSRSASIRRTLVPAEGSTAREGPGYTSEMERFVRSRWDLEAAQEHAPSLERCLRSLKALG